MSQLGLRFAQGNLFLMQLFFGLFVFDAVHDDHREKSGVASTCGDEDRADVGPHYPAIFVQETLLDTMISSLPVVCPRDTGFGGDTILFMGNVRSCACLEFILGIGEHFLKGQV